MKSQAQMSWAWFSRKVAQRWPVRRGRNRSVTRPTSGAAGRDASRRAVLARRNARLVAVVTRLTKLFNTHSSMPALRRRDKLVIPQNLSDPAPDREVASRGPQFRKPQVSSSSLEIGSAVMTERYAASGGGAAAGVGEAVASMLCCQCARRRRLDRREASECSVQSWRGACGRPFVAPRAPALRREAKV